MGTTKIVGSPREVYICDTLYSVSSDYRELQNKNKTQYGKNYKRYILKKVKNKFGKLVEYTIVESYYKNNKVEIVFIRKDCTYSGTDIVRYPFKIIHHELGIGCRFYDLRGSFVTLRKGCEIKDIAEVLGNKRIETTEKYYISTTSRDKEKVANAKKIKKVKINLVEFDQINC